VNPILAEGPERFAGRIAEAGAGGVIIPDLPHGEAPAIDAALRERGLAAVPLIAPTTTPERLAEICTAAEGFIYLVATTGTTGERSEVSETLAEQIEAIRAETDVPVAVGFGIGTAEQAGAVGALADGVIIGSRLVRTVAEADSPAAAAAACAEFLANCRTALLRA